MDRERLLNSLQERIAAYDDGDAGLVLAPEALTEADQLLDQLGTAEGTDLTVLRAVGLVHLARWSLLYEQAPDGAAASARLAVGCLIPVYLVAPDAVSETVAAEIRPRLSPPEAGQAGWAHDLGIALGLVAHATGHPPVFQDAIAALVEAALVSAERTDPRRPGYLAVLGSMLRMRYERLGGPFALTNAISALTESVSTSGSEDPELPSRLAELGFALRLDFERTSEPAALDKAIMANRRALELCPVEDPNRADILSLLAISLIAGAMSKEEPALAEEAVEVGREAIHPSLGLRLSALGRALSARYDRTSEPADLEAALEVDRRAVGVIPAGHPGRGRMLGNLSAGLFQHYLLIGDRDSIESAVRAAREAVDATPDGHPSKPIRLINLAGALDELSDRIGKRRLVLEAVRVAEVAAASTTATPFTRLRAARVWGRLAAMTDQWETAAAAFGQGVRLLPLVAPRNLHRPDVEHQLVEAGRIASNAAASAVWAGDAAGALEMLEQGRGVLLSYALYSRSELTDLRAVAPELAAEWETLGEELDTATAGPDEMPSEEAVPVPDPDHRHGLARRWQSLMSRIRATAGFERFLQPPVLADLLPAAASGAVVTVNVSDLRCDALVLTADRVRVVPLPDLDTEKLDTRVHTFLGALDVVGMGDFTESLGAQAALRRTLGWLWDVLAEPVLDELGHTATPAAGLLWPRVWWSPTGPLNFLPLHAAGRYQAQDGPAVLDRWCRRTRRRSGRCCTPDPGRSHRSGGYCRWQCHRHRDRLRCPPRAPRPRLWYGGSAAGILWSTRRPRMETSCPRWRRRAGCTSPATRTAIRPVLRTATYCCTIGR